MTEKRDVINRGSCPPADLPVAFHDLRPTDFPFTIEYIDLATGDVVLTQEVTGPGVLRIQSVDEFNGGKPARARFRYPDETIEVPW